VKGWLGTLPGLVVCGGNTRGGATREVRRLDLATMRWAPMPSLVSASARHACCAVRGALVVLGGRTHLGGYSSRVEILPEGVEAFVNLPSLSCGKIKETAAIAVEESESAAGQVLLLGGFTVPVAPSSSGAPGRPGHWDMHSLAGHAPCAPWFCGGENSGWPRRLRGWVWARQQFSGSVRAAATGGAGCRAGLESSAVHDSRSALVLRMRDE
jgi:hypothetical protein